MNIRRRIYLIQTALPRLLHRHGFGVQSPWAYELVQDVLYEKNAYYAYDDLQLKTESDRQLWRIKNRFFEEQLHIIDSSDADAGRRYNRIADKADEHTYIVLDGISSTHCDLWEGILDDPRATVTFDMGDRALITFDKKRIKQNYIL